MPGSLSNITFFIKVIKSGYTAVKIQKILKMKVFSFN